MKQGHASVSGLKGQKVEPKAHKVSEEAVNQLGEAVHFVKPPLTEGRGFEAPKNESHTTYKGGSQGRHG